MRAKKRVFNDSVPECVVGGGIGNVVNRDPPDAASLQDLVPRGWNLQPNNSAGEMESGRGQQLPKPCPHLPQVQHQSQAQQAQQLPIVDEHLLHVASPMSAAAETTPTRPATTTPRSRRYGVSGSGKRISTAAQKCIKFNQEESGKNQTILKYFSKKN